MSVGERIIALRKEAGLSQGQLASRMEVSRQAVSKWENDIAFPDTLKMIQLADILNTDVEYLATGKEPEAAEPQVVTTVEVQEKIVEVEKLVEVPVVKVVEKPVTHFVDRTVEKPVIKKVIRFKYRRNPVEFVLVGAACFLVGFLLGLLF